MAAIRLERAKSNQAVCPVKGISVLLSYAPVLDAFDRNDEDTDAYKFENRRDGSKKCCEWVVCARRRRDKAYQDTRAM